MKQIPRGHVRLVRCSKEPKCVDHLYFCRIFSKVYIKKSQLTDCLGEKGWEQT